MSMISLMLHAAAAAAVAPPIALAETGLAAGAAIVVSRSAKAKILRQPLTL